MRRIALGSLFIVMLLAPGAALAKLPPQAPPPDPSRGESYDGRKPVREPTGRKVALFVPRLLTFAPRIVLKAVRLPVLAVVEFRDRRTVANRDRAADFPPSYGVSPLLTTGSGPFRTAIGAKVWANDLFGPGIAPVAIGVATSGPSYVESWARITPNPSLPLGGGVALRMARRSDDAFYGMAGEVPWGASDDDLLRRIKVLTAEAGAFVVLRPGGGAGMWRYRLDGAVAFRDFGPPSEAPPVEPMNVPRFDDRPTFLTAKLSVDRIGRFDVSRALDGLDLTFAVAPSVGIGDDESRWVTATATGAYGVPVGRGRGFVISGYLADQHSWGAEEPSFVDRITLGGSSGWLRGFHSRRFRGGSGAVLGVDYRFPLHMTTDGFLFLEEGGVFGEHFEGFRVDRLRTSFGVGTRVFLGGNMIRLTLGYGVGDGVYVALAFGTGT